MNFPCRDLPPSNRWGVRPGPITGIVLWSSINREQCVIWCEDSEQLAFLSGRSDLVDGDWPAAGSLVELQSEAIGNIRRARQVRRLPGEIDTNHLLGC